MGDRTGPSGAQGRAIQRQPNAGNVIEDEIGAGLARLFGLTGDSSAVGEDIVRRYAIGAGYTSNTQRDPNADHGSIYGDNSEPIQSFDEAVGYLNQAGFNSEGERRKYIGQLQDVYKKSAADSELSRLLNMQDRTKPEISAAQDAYGVTGSSYDPQARAIGSDVVMDLYNAKMAGDVALNNSSMNGPWVDQVLAAQAKDDAFRERQDAWHETYMQRLNRDEQRLINIDKGHTDKETHLEYMVKSNGTIRMSPEGYPMQRKFGTRRNLRTGKLEQFSMPGVFFDTRMTQATGETDLYNEGLKRHGVATQQLQAIQRQYLASTGTIKNFLDWADDPNMSKKLVRGASGNILHATLSGLHAFDVLNNAWRVHNGEEQIPLPQISEWKEALGPDKMKDTAKRVMAYAKEQDLTSWDNLVAAFRMPGESSAEANGRLYNIATTLVMLRTYGRQSASASSYSQVSDASIRGMMKEFNRFGDIKSLNKFIAGVYGDSLKQTKRRIDTFITQAELDGYEVPLSLQQSIPEEDIDYFHMYGTDNMGIATQAQSNVRSTNPGNRQMFGPNIGSTLADDHPAGQEVYNDIPDILTRPDPADKNKFNPMHRQIRRDEY